MSDLDKKVMKARDKGFPMKLGKGYWCTSVSEELFNPFIMKNFNKVFPPNKRCIHFSYKDVTKKRQQAKRELSKDYLTSHCDYILFYNKNNEPVGWMTGEADDGQTYYMRNTGILKSHQGNKIYRNFLMKFEEYIKDLGYERISGQHHGNNTQVLVPKLKAGFIITGFENHENHGTLIKLVKHLQKDRQDIYIDKFNI